MATDHASPPIKDGVCLWCGSGVLESGDHLREDLEPCATILALVSERDEALQRVRELEADPDRPTVVYAGDELEAAEAALVEARQKIDRLTARGIEDLKFSLAEAEAERDALAAALREFVDECGIVADDPRLGYVEVQINPGCLERGRAALAAVSPSTHVADQ